MPDQGFIGLGSHVYSPQLSTLQIKEVRVAKHSLLGMKP